VGVSLLLAFLGGVGSFLSPCVLPLVPVYLSTISGFNAPSPRRLRVIASASLFFLGFSGVFVLGGLSLGALGERLSVRGPESLAASGLVMVLLGLMAGGYLHLPFLDREWRIRPFIRYPLVGPLIAGAAYGIGWSPCIGPILASILTYVVGTQDARGGSMLLSMYCLGFSIPFLLLASFWDKVLQYLMALKPLSRHVNMVSSLVLIGVGSWLALKGFWALF